MIHNNLPNPIVISPHGAIRKYEVPLFSPTKEYTESYKVNYEYINNSPVDLHLIDINNQSMVLHAKPRGERRGSGFTVLKHYEWHDKKVTFNVERLYSEVMGSKIKLYVDEDRKKSNEYEDVFATMLTDASNTTDIQPYRRGSISLNVSDELFRENNYCLYIKELGLVVTTDSQVDYVLHPASTEGIAKTQSEAIEHATIFQLYANDPQRKEFGTRYVNLNNAVYKVPVIANAALPAGVYITEPITGTGDVYSDTVTTIKRYEFAEADKVLNLYKTYSEAKDHYGLATAQLEERNIYKSREFIVYKEQISKEAERIKNDHLLMKQQQEIEYGRQTNLLKQEIEQLKAEGERRSAELKARADRMDYRSMGRKDQYEAASYSRKGWSEIIKWIPGILAGALTCVGIAFALFL